jgi:DNA-binding beta-propeller fold protein YncE
MSLIKRAEPDAETPRGIYISPRIMLIILAVVLLIALIALMVYLLMLFQTDKPRVVDSEPVLGLQAELVVTGPDEGEQPSFSQPMGAAWSPDGDLFHVADAQNNRVCTFRRDGRFVREFGGFGIAKPLPGSEATWNPGELNYPVDVATDERGNIYVADFHNDSVSVFGESGDFVRRFPDPTKVVGKGGSGQDGRGIAVTAVAVKGDKVYVTDVYQVLVFTLEGELVRQFGRPGLLDHPNGIVVNDADQIIVSDSNNNRLVAFSAEGEVIWTTGEPSVPGPSGETTETLVLPRGITTAERDSLLVADPIGQQIVELDGTGRVQNSYGRRGASPAELNFPNDVDWHAGRLLVADRANDRVQILLLVEK